MSKLLEAELAPAINSLGKLIKDKYLIEPQCFESIRDIIRFLRKDNENHEVRHYLGRSKILQNDLIHIATSSNDDSLFDITIRLLVNLTSPVLLLFKEEVPTEKVAYNLYLNLLAYTQEYKAAFCSVEFWNVVRNKLTELFEIDWTERSEDDCFRIERMMVLLRNVLQVPAATDLESRPDNDITVHDKVLWALRESQLLSLLLYVSSNPAEDRYYLHLLEVFSLILREQNPANLAKCEIQRSAAEKEADSKELAVLRQKEKERQSNRNYTNVRNFTPTFVLKNVKSVSENEVIYHKNIDKLGNLKLTQNKKRLKTPKNRFPVESERVERRSTFSVRLFLKEFCVELLSCSFNQLMKVVKDKLIAGKGLLNDETYYFWALKFFLEFSCAANSDIKLISECISVETFHFLQMQIEKCYDTLVIDKKKTDLWIRRLHLMLKAYRSLLQTLLWMDQSKDPQIVETSRVLKSKVFYVVEYRELLLNCMLKYDPAKFPKSFLRDLVETNHLNIKLLEDYCKNNKVIVQRKKKTRKKAKKVARGRTAVSEIENSQVIWDRIKDSVLEVIEKKEEIPDIPPFDAASDLPIDEQREEAMKNVQKKLREEQIKEAIGLLRSSRQVWPENDFFGAEHMSPEEETMALQEICLADLGVNYGNNRKNDIGDNNLEKEEEEEEGGDSDEEDQSFDIEEECFDVRDYIKRLVNIKVIEGCSILLNNYKTNTSNTNHCLAKLLHRIGWDCAMPTMLYQASIFIAIQKLLREKDPEYKELQKLSIHLFRKFRANAATNPKIYMELLFWKDVKTAFDIENGYGKSEERGNHAGWSEEEEDELRRLWVESDEVNTSSDKIEWIRDNLINQSRSRTSIIRKLKELMLITPGTRVLKVKKSRVGWSDDEIVSLRELYTVCKDAVDVAESIREKLGSDRSKKAVKEKLVELGLVDSLKDLRKRRAKKINSSLNGLINVEPLEESSESEEETEFSESETGKALEKVLGMKTALEWLRQTFEECIDDEGDGATTYPLLAIDDAQSEALKNVDFVSLLRKLGLIKPKGTTAFWSIPIHDRLLLDTKLELIKSALSGNLAIAAEKKDLNAPETIDVDDHYSNATHLVNYSRSDTNHSKISRPVDSDRSDHQNSSDEGMIINKPRKTLKKYEPSAVLGSDSDGDEPSRGDIWKHKRRRGCIGSDSEIEENKSDNDNEAPVRFKEVRKRARMIGSDSE